MLLLHVSFSLSRRPVQWAFHGRTTFVRFRSLAPVSPCLYILNVLHTLYIIYKLATRGPYKILSFPHPARPRYQMPHLHMCAHDVYIPLFFLLLFFFRFFSFFFDGPFYLSFCLFFFGEWF